MTKKRKFIGDASSYQKARPNYPEELFDFILQFWNQVADTLKPTIVDLGCGTGIATRGMYQRCQTFYPESKIIGIEPDLQMLEKAKQASSFEPILYKEGNAEKPPLEDNTVDILMVAQAIHYFDRQQFYSEAKRVLRASGVIAIIENNRNWKNSPFLEKYEAFLEKNAYDEDLNYYFRDYRVFPLYEELQAHFNSPVENTFHFTKRMNVHDFWEMMKSSTSGKQAIHNLGQERAKNQILKLAQEFQSHDGLIDIPYISKAYMARNNSSH